MLHSRLNLTSEDQLKVQEMKVTKAMAEHWLKGNKENRRFRENYARTLAAAMDRGEWTLNHQPIALVNGRLLDGQHRLSALLMSKCASLPMLVATDVPASTFDTIDVGIKRSVADVFGLPAQVVGPISVVCRVIYGTRWTAKQIEDILKKLKPMSESLHMGKLNRYNTAKIRAGALCAMLDSGELEYVRGQQEAMATLDTDNMCRSVRALVRQISMSAINAGGHDFDHVMRAHQAFMPNNADLSKLQIRDSGARLESLRVMLRSKLKITAEGKS